MPSLPRNQAFRRLLSAQFLAITAAYALSLGGIVVTETRFQSSAQTGLVILSAILPAFLGSLIAGAVVDRVGRRRILVASSLASVVACASFWLGTLLLPDSLTLVAIVAANITLALFSQFAMTSELAMLPDAVSQPQLLQANSAFQLSMLAAEGLGVLILSPVVIKVAGMPAVGLVGAGLSLVAALLASLLPPNLDISRPDERTGWAWTELAADLRAGWQVIANDKVLTLVAIQATLAASLLLVLVSLFPGLANRHLAFAVEDAIYLLLPGGIGFVLISSLMGRWQSLLSRQQWIALGLMALGICTGLVALLSSGPSAVWPVAAILFVLGSSLALVLIPARTLLQERPPAELRGRVIAAQLALSNAAAVIPLWLGGSLADQVGIRPVMAVLGVIALGAGLLGWRKMPD
jgi:MFS family permease